MPRPPNDPVDVMRSSHAVVEKLAVRIEARQHAVDGLLDQLVRIDVLVDGRC
jgi:hypothetical protein